MRTRHCGSRPWIRCRSGMLGSTRVDAITIIALPLPQSQPVDCHPLPSWVRQCLSLPITRAHTPFWPSSPVVHIGCRPFPSPAPSRLRTLVPVEPHTITTSLLLQTLRTTRRLTPPQPLPVTMPWNDANCPACPNSYSKPFKLLPSLLPPHPCWQPFRTDDKLPSSLMSVRLDGTCARAAVE